MGHFLLTKLLLPVLLKTAETAGPGRVVNVSSSAHGDAPKGGIGFEDVNLAGSGVMLVSSPCWVVVSGC